MRILLRWDGDSKMKNTVRTRQKAIMSLARNGSSELRDIDLDFSWEKLSQDYCKQPDISYNATLASTQSVNSDLAS